MSFDLGWLLRQVIFQFPLMRWLRAGMGLLLAFLIFLYVFLSMGLRGLARKLSVRGSFWAWVPVGQSYVAGAIADRAGGGHFFAAFLPCLQASALLALFLAVGAPGVAWLIWVLAIAFYVFWCIALGRIYGQFARFSAPLLVLSIIFAFLGPIFLFALRNSEPHPYGRPPQKQTGSGQPGVGNA